jgi:hypothetical protein
MGYHLGSTFFLAMLVALRIIPLYAEGPTIKATEENDDATTSDVAVVVCYGASTGAGRAVTEADFEAKTTQHLLNLCTAPPNDPRYREAIHFCHGYLVGASHYHLSETAGEGGQPLVCFPTPSPSRNEAIRMFIA